MDHSSSTGERKRPTRPASHHKRTSSILSGLNTLSSYLVNASSSTSRSDAELLPTDTELELSDPTTPEWADGTSAQDPSPQKATFKRPSTATNSPKALIDVVHLRGSPSAETSPLSKPINISSIAFAAPAMSQSPRSSSDSSLDQDALDSAQYSSPQPSTSSTFIAATSVRTTPPQSHVKLQDDTLSRDSTVKAAPRVASHSRTTSPPQWQTLPKSFASPPCARPSARRAFPEAPTISVRTTSLSMTSADKEGEQTLPKFKTTETRTADRTAGFPTRSINSIRGIAAAWVPARFTPSQASSAAGSESSSNAGSSSSDNDKALEPYSSNGKQTAQRGPKRPVRLDRRRLDKAVSLAVEAAQAAEEDERAWEEKQHRKAKAIDRRQRYLSTSAITDNSSALGLITGPAQEASLPAFKSSNMLTKSRQWDERRGSVTSQNEDDAEDEDDLGFSLDLYISSLGYLISAISDREASGLNEKQRLDMRKRLEEGMSKLGFDAKAELEKAEALKRELELEKEKAAIRQQQGPSVIHHHYHQASSASMFGEGAFTRAHAAAKASERTTSFAGKIGTSVLDIGLTIGAGALSALSANLLGIAPKATLTSLDADSPKITDLETDEELEIPRRDSVPASGATTPRTAWVRAIGQNNKQWELAVAFASSAASALAISLGTITRSDGSHSPASTPAAEGLPVVRREEDGTEYTHLLDPAIIQEAKNANVSAEDRLILLSVSLARALKRSPLPSQLYQLLGQIVSLLSALDSKYSLTERGTQIAVHQTSLALHFVRKHDLHVKAVRVAWAAAEAAVAALEAYRAERDWHEIQSATHTRLAAVQRDTMEAKQMDEALHQAAEQSKPRA